MVDTNQQVIEEARQRDDMLTSREMLLMIERQHRPDGPGVDQELLDAYDDAVGRDAAIPFEEGELRESVERRLSDDERWVDEDTYYRLGDGRISVFPAEWHDALGDTRDVREYVDVIGEAMGESGPGADSRRGGVGTGVPEGLVLEAASVIGGLDQGTAKERLEQRRDDGELVEDADQHPNARIHLAEDAEWMRDDSLQD